jgi:hypothetical protein
LQKAEAGGRDEPKAWSLTAAEKAKELVKWLALIEAVHSREQCANSSGERETPKDEFCHMCVEAGREKGEGGDRENPTGYEDGKNQRRGVAAASLGGEQ